MCDYTTKNMLISRIVAQKEAKCNKSTHYFRSGVSVKRKKGVCVAEKVCVCAAKKGNRPQDVSVLY